MITNSTQEYDLNSYSTEGADNSNIPDRVMTTTGNESRKKGLQVLNDTYTCSSKTADLVVNAQLLNWNSAVVKKCGEIDGVLTALEGAGRLVGDQDYAIYGHPDKWVADYSQSYNNCGVNSSLNVLGMAGVKDIVEQTTAYKDYLKTSKTTTKTYMALENGVWTKKTETVVTYPKAQTSTEDAFLLWAVQNSPNDKLWYENIYGEFNDPTTGLFPIDLTLPQDKTYLDFCLHSENYDAYKTIKDLEGKADEVGGANVIHMDNILEYWGVESSIHLYANLTEAEKSKYSYVDDFKGGINYMVMDPDTTVKDGPVEIGLESIKETLLDPFKFEGTGESQIGGEDKKVEATVTVTYDNTYTEKTTVTEIVETDKEEEPVAPEGGEGTEGNEGGQGTGTGNTGSTGNTSNNNKEENEQKFTITEVEYATNLEKYTYLESFADYVETGKGVILEGFATKNYSGPAGTGAAHAITLVGVVYGKAITGHTTWAIDGEQVQEEFNEDRDIVGLYVIDTGGWLENPEKAQFITPDQLYHFLTNGHYSEAPGGDKEHMFWGAGSTYTYVNVTDNNIREWADDLNIVGNNRKNVLVGNEATNHIYGKDGNDSLYGAGGDDYLYGDGNDDGLYGGAGNNVLNGGKGNDIYIFESENGVTNDTIIAGSGKDYIQFDSYVTQYGNKETLECEGIEYTQNMNYYNKNGDLYIEYNIKGQDNPSSITVQNYFSKSLFNSIKDIQAYEHLVDNLGAVVETKEKERLDFLTNFIQRGHISYLVDESKNNTLKGSKYMDSIVGGNRNDSITGANGRDIINGGASNDTIKGGNDDDVIWGSYGNDKIYGDAGNDTIIYRATENIGEKNFAGSAYGGCDTIYSGKGEDYIELKDYEASNLMYTKAGKDLVITYDTTTDSSITIANYFGKKGNTSIKGIKLKGNRTLDLVGEYNYGANILANAIVGVKGSTTFVGTNGYDSIKGGSGNDSITGALGKDTLYGGKGDDTLNGGLNSDKLYGQAGNNTYEFDNKASGSDTIYTSGNGKSTIKFTAQSGVNFNEVGVVGNKDFNEYAFTKYKNNLIIDYATSLQDRDNATITISNFFKSKGAFEIVNADGTTIDLKEKAIIYMEGTENKKNKITGSNYNDSIVGGNINDTLKGGKGNDIIVGGKGNDNITGGSGNNSIIYNYNSKPVEGDGSDVINLTKNEHLSIKLNGIADVKKLDYEIVKKDLVISYINDKGEKEKLFTLKNFGTKDVTTANGSVKLYNVDTNGNETMIMDLRVDSYLDDYTAFTPKNYKYKGNWHTEVIDASSLNFVDTSKNRGANINAYAGNDTIYGSYKNDTINAGDGDDVIHSYHGTNKVDGGNGKDEYHIFEKGQTGTETTHLPENTTIKDTGKDGAVDVAKLHCTVKDIKNGKLWFNVKTKDFDTEGNYINKNITFNVSDGNGNTATITGVEELYVDGKKYDINKVAADVASWLTSDGRSFADVQTALNKSIIDVDNMLYAKFTEDQYFV